MESQAIFSAQTQAETCLLNRPQWYRADFGESTNAMVKWVKKRVKDEVRKLQQEFKYVVGYSDNRILPQLYHLAQLYNSVMI